MRPSQFTESTANAHLQRRPGDKVKLRIWRDGKELIKEVRLEARDESVATTDSSSEPTLANLKIQKNQFASMISVFP
jgi:hypothetical protein